MKLKIYLSSSYVFKVSKIEILQQLEPPIWKLMDSGKCLQISIVFRNISQMMHITMNNGRIYTCQQNLQAMH